MKGTIFLLKKLTKLLLISIYDNRIQSIDPVENYSYGTGKDLICKYEKNQ